jgi:H+/Cl- antiporter ClcA
VAIVAAGQGRKMNPLEWKREHQIALLCAIALGCFSGFIVGLLVLDSHTRFRWGALWCEWQYSCVYFLNGYWLRVLSCSILGGVSGATLVYIRQLLRA